MSEPRSDDRGVGARLRSARERRRMTILQAAERLHVDPDILEALEADNFAALGAPVYLKGHLRHYAELVGESPEALQGLITSSAAPLPQPDLTRAPRPAMDEGARLAGPALLVLLAFALAGSAWWAMSLSHRGPRLAGSHPVPALTRVAAGPAAGRARSALPRPRGSRAPGAKPLARAIPVAKAPIPGAVAGASPVATATPAGMNAPVAAGAMRLQLKFSASSWVEVYDAGGHRLLYSLVAAPAARTLEGRGPVRVVLGNAPGVTLEVDGRAASFARFVRADHRAQFLVTAGGRLMPVEVRTRASPGG